MKLLNLTLDNFKGTKHYSLDLPNGCSAAVYGENGAGKTTLADAWCWLLFGVDSQGQSDSKNGGFQVATKGTSGLDYSVSATIEVDGRVHILRRVYREDFSRKNGESEKGQAKNHTDYYLDDTPLKTKKQYDTFIDTLFPSREIGRALTIPSYFPGELEPNARRELLLKLFAPEITEDSVIERHPELARLRTYKNYKTVEQYRDWAKAQRTAVNKELDSIPGRIDEANLAKLEDIPTQEDEAVFQRLQAEKAKLAMKISAARNGSDAADAQRRKDEAEAQLARKKAEYMGKFLHANDSLNADAQALRKEISDKERDLFLLKRKNEERVLFMENIRKEIKRLGGEWQEWQEKCFDESSTICPTVTYALTQNDEAGRVLLRTEHHGWKFERICHVADFSLANAPASPIEKPIIRKYGGKKLMKSNLRNEIKSYIVRQGMTMQEIVDLLRDEHGWSDSVSNLSNKLQRESLRYVEAVQLADALGYEIVWQKRR